MAADLRNALVGHVGLVEEDLAKVLPVRKDLGLSRQVGATRVNYTQINKSEGLHNSAAGGVEVLKEWGSGQL